MTAPVFKLLNTSDEVKSFFKSGDILRVYEFGLAPDKPKTPYLVWQQLPSSPLNNLDGPAVTDHISIQFDIYTHDVRDIDLIKSAVRRTLEQDNSCTITGLRSNSREHDTKLYRTGFDSNWFVDR